MLSTFSCDTATPPAPAKAAPTVTEPETAKSAMAKGALARVRGDHSHHSMGISGQRYRSQKKIIQDPLGGIVPHNMYIYIYIHMHTYMVGSFNLGT